MTATDESVVQDFSSLGTVTSVKLLENPRGMAALVRFATLEEAIFVKQSLHGRQPNGFPEPLEVKFAKPQVKGNYDKGKGKGDNGKGGCRGSRGPTPGVFQPVGVVLSLEWICTCGFRNKGANQVCGGDSPAGCKALKSDIIEEVS